MQDVNFNIKRAMDLGLFELKERTINNPDGSIRITLITKVTGKGQAGVFRHQISGGKGRCASRVSHRA